MRSPLSVRVIAATGNSTCLSGHVGATIRFKKKKKIIDSWNCSSGIKIAHVNFHSFIFKAFTFTSVSKYCFYLINNMLNSKHYSGGKVRFLKEHQRDSLQKDRTRGISYWNYTISWKQKDNHRTSPGNSDSTWNRSSWLSETLFNTQGRYCPCINHPDIELGQKCSWGLLDKNLSIWWKTKIWRGEHA